MTESEQLKIDFAMTFTRLVEYFDYDYIKLLIWFHIDNVLLGDLSPWDMILIKREKKLIDFINSQLDGNMP